MLRHTLLLFLCWFPLCCHAWRGYEMYTGASFGVLVGDTYEVVSTNPENEFESLNFNSGAQMTGYLGYSINQYFAIEGSVIFGKIRMKDNYFTPSQDTVIVDSIFTSSTTTTTETNTVSGEWIRLITLDTNMVINLDTGSDFMPFFGGGVGILLASWSGFGTTGLFYTAFAGGDLLLMPGYSLFLRIQYIGSTDLDFETVHEVKQRDENGDVITDVNNRPIYERRNFSDTIKDFHVGKFDLGVRLAF